MPKLSKPLLAFRLLIVWSGFGVFFGRWFHCRIRESEHHLVAEHHRPQNRYMPEKVVWGN